MQQQNKLFFFARVFSDPNLYKVSSSVKQEFRYGAEVIIETELGPNIAVITSWETDNEVNNTKCYLSGHLIRYATEEDKIKRKLLRSKYPSIKAQINTLINSLNLNMYVTNILLPLSDNSICIYYTAPERVDFRLLLTELKNTFKTKIILKHLNQRERRSSFLFSSDLHFYNEQDNK
jgi:cell fate regulator YaaT (PSP1 superfamily)